MFSEGDNKDDKQAIGDPVDGLYSQAIDMNRRLIKRMDPSLARDLDASFGANFIEQLRFALGQSAQLIQNLRETNRRMKTTIENLEAKLTKYEKPAELPHPFVANHKKELYEP